MGPLERQALMDGASRSEVILARRQDEIDSRAGREESRRDRAESRGRREDKRDRQRQSVIDAQRQESHRLNTQSLRQSLSVFNEDRRRSDERHRLTTKAAEDAAALRDKEKDKQRNLSEGATRSLLAGDLWSLKDGYTGSLAPEAVAQGYDKGAISDIELRWIDTARALADDNVGAAPQWITNKANPEQFIKNARYLLNAAHDRALREKGHGGSLTQGEFAAWVARNKPKGVSGKPIDPTMAAMYLRFRLARASATTGAKKSSVAWSDPKGRPLMSGRTVGDDEVDTNILISPLSTVEHGGVGASKAFLGGTLRPLIPRGDRVGPKPSGWFADSWFNRQDIPEEAMYGGGPVLGGMATMSPHRVSAVRYPGLNPAENPEKLRELRLANKPSQGPKSRLSDEEYLLGEYGVR